MSRRKLRLPEGFDALAAAAEQRLVKRQAPPRIRIEKGRNGWQFSSPYAHADGQRWFAMLADAFGTRHRSIVDHFLGSICDLVRGAEWNDEKRFWYPDETEFNAV